MAPKNGRCLTLEFMEKDGTLAVVHAQRQTIREAQEKQAETSKTPDAAKDSPPPEHPEK